jgi:polysaccharide export outer membrane protein
MARVPSMTRVNRFWKGLSTMHASIRILLVLTIAILAVGCSSVTRMPPAPASIDYRIQEGDRLEFSLYQEGVGGEQTPLQVTVLPDGKVMVPYVGEIMAEGRTSQELLDGIKAELKKKFTTAPTPHFSVNIYPSRVVQVLGMVIRPGQYDLTHEMRVTDAMSQAGGYRPVWGAPNDTLLLRRTGSGEKTYDIFFGEILERGDGRTNYVLEPGDVIYVPPTPFRKAAIFVEDVLAPVHALISPITAPVTAIVGF